VRALLLLLLLLQVIVVNGKPFPTLDVDVNDRVIVKVTNKLNEPLSVHWHGMLQVGSRRGVRAGVWGLRLVFWL
jgi:FtsP/CotA-like multicopper oxidase with cupredoxin domain